MPDLLPITTETDHTHPVSDAELIAAAIDVLISAADRRQQRAAAGDGSGDDAEADA